MIIFSVAFQMPLAKRLKKFTHTQALSISLLFWGLGFICVVIAGNIPELLYLGALTAMILLAIASVSYTPVASALVVDLAPENLRGVFDPDHRPQLRHHHIPAMLCHSRPGFWEVGPIRFALRHPT